MPRVNRTTHQDTLDSLRRTRRTLYAIPEPELSAMALDDQVKYGESLSQVTSAILQLETMKLKNVNKAFAAEQQALNAATKQLETDLAQLQFANEVVRTASSALSVVAKVVALA